MTVDRIGQILTRVAALSDHDVEEILQEQRATRLRFGDAALSLGFVNPDEVGSALGEQLGGFAGEIDLDVLGIDPLATHYLDYNTAHLFTVVPVRCSVKTLVIASAAELCPADQQAIDLATAQHVVFVRAPEAQVRRVLQQYYPPRSPVGVAA